NAYQACEALCQEFKKIKEKTHRADENANKNIEASLTQTYKTSFDPTETERSNYIKLIELQKQGFMPIEAEITALEVQLNKLVPEIKDLPPKLLKIAKDSDEYHLEDAPLLDSVQESFKSIKSKIAAEREKLTTLALQIENEIHFKRVC